MFQPMLQIPDGLIFIVLLFCGGLSLGFLPELEEVFVDLGEGVRCEQQKVVGFIDDGNINVALFGVVLFNDLQILEKHILNFGHVYFFIAHEMRDLINRFDWILRYHSEFLCEIIVFLSEIP